MNDLISRSALLEAITFDRKAAKVHPREICERFERFCDYAEEVVKDALAVDAEVVRHGRWDEDTVPFCNVCPECGAVVERHCVKHNGSLKRCPNCGTKMDGEMNG